ncbi:MAG TPA: DUF4124 domain-containing protein [Ramlibacter sp.]|nr:DUF4124 domain-containing protein [Ramlibacter sp.]
MGAKRLPATLLALLALAPALSMAQSKVFTCTDAKGRRLTSDRLIPECHDREHTVIDARGVRTVIPPPPTAKEREAQAELERRQAEEKQRQVEEKRVERALLARYPTQAAHDAERAKALRSVQDVSASAQRHIDLLLAQRKKLQEETEFYKDPAKYPVKLKRQLEEIEQQLAAQQRFLARQDDEKKRVNAKFDEELAKLKTLWAPVAAQR